MSRAPRPAERIAWLALVVTLLVPIWWGGDRFAWENSIAPTEVLKFVASRFAPDFFLTYGPVPYVLFAIPTVALIALFKLIGELGHPSALYPWGFRHPEMAMTAFVTSARLVTLALALILVRLAASGGDDRDNGRRAADGGHGWLVPVLFLGSPMFGYYARTANVDLHYLFWAWLAIHLFETAKSPARLHWAAVAAVLAVGTKEQSAPLAAVALIGATLKAWTIQRGGFLKAVTVGLAAVAAYVVVWRLPYALEGWRLHHEFIFGSAKYPRVFPPTLLGHLGLARRSLTELPSVLGFPVLLGLALALLFRPSVRGLGLRFWACAAYAVGFLGAIGYVYERFLLPFLLLAVPLAARGYAAAARALGERAAARVLAPVMVLLALAGGPYLSWVMLDDPRYRVERWLRTEVPAGASVEIAGNPHYQARVPATRMRHYTTLDSLRSAARRPLGDVVLLSSIDAYSFERDSTARAVWFAELTRAGAYRKREFRLPPGAWLVRGIEVPSVTAYVREGLGESQRR